MKNYFLKINLKNLININYLREFNRYFLNRDKKSICVYVF